MWLLWVLTFFKEFRIALALINEHNTKYDTMNRKLIFALLPMAVMMLSNCSKDSGKVADTAQEERIIAANTLDTIIKVSIDDFEIPIYLSIPDGCESESLPAVVVMHGSYGMWSKNDPSSETMSGQFTEWQNILAENCMIGAFVDSYTGRGVTTRTGEWRELPSNIRISAQFQRTKDANAALTFLQNLKYDDGSNVVQGTKIVLLGFSDGASAVLASLIDLDKVPQGFEWTQSADGKSYTASDGILSPQTKPQTGFAGGIFYYGGSVGYNYFGKHPCNVENLQENVFYPYAPMLFQIPSDDELTENTLCLIDVLQSKEAPIEMLYYEGMSHGFDFDDVPESEQARTSTINWIKSNLNMN